MTTRVATATAAAAAKKNQDEYKQLCIWQGAPLGAAEGLVAADSLRLLEHFGFRVQHKESVLADGGERDDVLFAIHRDDIGRFAVERLCLLHAASSLTYGIMYKDALSRISVQQQVEFFHQHGVDSFLLTCEFATCFVFSFSLFNAEQADEDEQEKQAEAAIETFIAAYKQYEMQFPGSKPSQMLNSGSIRWWEDALRNGGASIYAPEIIEKYKPCW
jgi:hypothetical protein